MKALAGCAVFMSMFLAACVISPDPGVAGADQSRLTQEEILNSGVTNLYDAVMRLRPRWIRDNTPVYMDGIRIGQTEALRDWPHDTALSMEYLDPMVAQQRLPEFNPSDRNITGVISIRTRSP